MYANEVTTTLQSVTIVSIPVHIALTLLSVQIKSKIKSDPRLQIFALTGENTRHFYGTCLGTQYVFITENNKTQFCRRFWLLSYLSNKKKKKVN